MGLTWCVPSLIPLCGWAGQVFDAHHVWMVRPHFLRELRVEHPDVVRIADLSSECGGAGLPSAARGCACLAAAGCQARGWRRVVLRV